MIIAFTREGWEDYQYLLQNNRKLLAKLNKLVEDIIRSPFDGLGKPEALKNDLQCWWSRRIDEEHRVVYQVRNDTLMINQCYRHY